MGSYYAPSPGHPGFVPMPPGVPRPAPSESERDASERIVPSPMMTGWGGYYGGAAHTQQISGWHLVILVVQEEV